MRICIASESSGYSWTKGGEDIRYQKSRLVRRPHADKSKVKYYY